MTTVQVALAAAMLAMPATAATRAFGGTAGTATSCTTTLTFTNTMMRFFSGYVFTTRNPGNVLTDGDLGQGYRINSITADVLPEPGSWALLIIGFGFTGAAMRRRAAATA